MGFFKNIFRKLFRNRNNLLTEPRINEEEIKEEFDKMLKELDSSGEERKSSWEVYEETAREEKAKESAKTPSSEEVKDLIEKKVNEGVTPGYVPSVEMGENIKRHLDAYEEARNAHEKFVKTLDPSNYTQNDPTKESGTKQNEPQKGENDIIL